MGMCDEHRIELESIKKKMALHFVATSVLTSEDGIGFEKEVQLESDDARKSKAEAIKVKPLFEQLAEQNAKKQEEYDAMTKLIFGTR